MKTRHLTLYALALFMASMAPAAWSQTTATGNTASEAQAAAQQAAGHEASAVKSGTKIDAELASAIDAKTAKPGDKVEARVTKDVKQDGRVVVHKGDRLLGTVTQAQADATGKAGSQMSVAFDRLAGAAGETHLNAVLTSVFSSSSAADSQQGMDAEPLMTPMAMPAGGGSGAARGGLGGGLVEGATSTVGSAAGSTLGAAGSVAGSATGNVGSAVGRTTGATVNGATGTNAVGGANMGIATPVRAVHIQSNSQAEGQAGTASTLSTKHGDLRLNSGTRMQFKVASSTSADTSRN